MRCSFGTYLALLFLLLLHQCLLIQCQEEDVDTPLEPLTDQQIRNLHGKFDEDADGKVSLAETRAYSKKMSRIMATKDVQSTLAEADTDKDGKLSLPELQTFFHDLHDGITEREEDEQEGTEVAPQARQMESHVSKLLDSKKFKLADKNGDGELDLSELPAMFNPELHDQNLALVSGQVFKEKDADGDGLLTQKEFSVDEDADFQKLDMDGSGTIDKQELLLWDSGQYHIEVSLAKLFEVADTDGDAHITADELSAANLGMHNTAAYELLESWHPHHEL